jgi:NADPH-dependent 2,4-dienoyl-CoA reductase/sulfur reductase-like enzyme/rhodanese-related sulfurtransferase
MRIVVVGGVAAGMSFAARARRLAEDARIVVLERGPHVSFANCGLPYFVGGEIGDRDDLLLQTPQTLAAALALDVRTRHEVVRIARTRRTVLVRDLATGREYEEPYDALMLATGSRPVVPAIPGADLPQVHLLHTVPDAERVHDAVAAGARRAVVLGAGFIGLEAVEALRHRDVAVTLVELADRVLPPLDPEMSRAVEQALRRAGVDVRTGTPAAAVRPAPGGGVSVELSDGARLPADLVIAATGVRPDSALAAAAGLRLGTRGAVVVDEHLRTSDPAVSAAGDAVAVTDAVTGAPATVPLAGPANRQGRAAADHLLGRGGSTAPALPTLGTAIVRVFDVVAATTGRGEAALRAAGVPYEAVHLHHGQHAGYYPGARAIHLKLLFAPDGRILGAQATGADGVDKRIDVIATAMRAGLDVRALAQLELAYAPPFGSAKDPVNLAGFAASNVLTGDLALWRAADLDELGPAAVLVDVRSAGEFADGHLPGAVNIPHTQLRARLDEVPAGRPVFVYCASGVRSYLALRVLRQTGHPAARSLSGGLRTLLLERPDLALEVSAVPDPEWLWPAAVI